MYYNGGKTFLIAFLTALIVSGGISAVFTFYIGPGVSAKRAQRVEVPNIQRMDLEQAKLIIQQKGLFLWVEEERATPDVPSGSILIQDPLPGFPAEKGDLVKVVVSKAPEGVVVTGVKVPDLLGIPLPQAKLELERIELKVGEVEKVASDKVKEEYIISMGFYAGTEVPEGTRIDLKVSSGPPLVTVPKLFRKSLSQAESILKKAGLSVGQVRQVTDIEYPFGIVVGQSPRAGAKVKKGSQVDVSINAEAGG